jgi:hypothetical protein
MIDFIRRRNLSVRIPQFTNINRVTAFEKEKVTRFFELLKVVYDNDKIEPRHARYTSRYTVKSCMAGAGVVTLHI